MKNVAQFKQNLRTFTAMLEVLGVLLLGRTGRYTDYYIMAQF